MSTRSPKLLQRCSTRTFGAQARAGGDVDVGEVGAAGAGLGLHLLVVLETGLVLGLAGLGAAAHPLELVLQALGELGVALALGLRRAAFVSR